MDFFEAVRQRRAVKTFDPEHRMSDDEVEKLLEATILSPTSFNIQHWRFVQVVDPALRREIRAAANGQAQVTDASVLFVTTADVKAWAKSPERYWSNAPPEVAEMMIGFMAAFHEGREELQRDEAMRSIGIAIQTMMLGAKAMGYDSCPMIGFDHAKVAELIRMPDDHVIGPMVAVGVATQPARARGGQLELGAVLVRDRFGA